MIDFVQFKKNVGGTKTGRRRLLQLILVDTKNKWRVIERAVKQRNWKEVAEQLHKLKATLGFLSVKKAIIVITRIEEIIEKGSLSKDRIKDLERLVKKLGIIGSKIILEIEDFIPPI